MTNNRFLLHFLAALALLAVSCSDTQTETSRAGADVTSNTGVDESTDEDAEPEGEGRSGPFSAGRFFDETLPTTAGPQPYYIQFDTARDLAEAAGYAFTGRIVGTEEKVYILGPDPEEVDGGIRYEFDGAIFEIDDVLYGNLKPGDTVSVAIPTVVIREANEPARMRADHLSIIEGGLQGDGSTFLVFASTRPGSSQLFFHGNSGVAKLPTPDGTLRGLPGSCFDNGDAFLGRAGAITLDIVRESLDGPSAFDEPPLPEDFEGDG
ncbi:MAG: hypothetical protein AAF081_17785 [Actinomycetota bacterium]